MWNKVTSPEARLISELGENIVEVKAIELHRIVLS